jgi:serine/threonine-protein kinase
MGIVYLARDVALDRPVAIKLLPPTLAENVQLRERFLREARTVAQLSHPNIVPIHAVEERDGLVFFVTSYIDGETLGERVRRSGPLTSRDAMRVMQEVAWALGHAHARGIVHRDVKPDNVLVDAESGRAIVTDFGIAAATGMSTPSGGIAIGTPQYLSPEQARGEEAEPRSDLYSLGATVWFALTGKPVFEGSLPQLLHRHGTETVPAVLSARADVPLSLARSIDRCLAKRAEDRPASADTLAAELGSALAIAPAVPAPIRAYLERASRSELPVYAAISSVALVQAGFAGLIGGAGGGTVAVTSAVAATAGAVVCAALLGIRARNIRALTLAGFDYRAVQRAIAQQVAATADIVPPARPGRAVVLGAAGGAISLALALIAARATSFGPGFLGAVGSIVTFVLTVIGVRDAIRPRAAGVEGPVMRWLERLLFRVVGAKNAPRAITDGEATVIALGGAIQNLWAGLPNDARAQLDDVPHIAAQLEDEAVRLRSRFDDPASAQRLQTVVTAMEGLRLDLLRVKAGTVEPSALTAQIDAARLVGEHVDALLRGRDEVESLLRPETTPV